MRTPNMGTANWAPSQHGDDGGDACASLDRADEQAQGQGGGDHDAQHGQAQAPGHADLFQGQRRQHAVRDDQFERTIVESQLRID